jgi:hypothetical protein
MGLETYQKMRDFRRTPEPRGKVAKRNLRRFVLKKFSGLRRANDDERHTAAGLCLFLMIFF